MAKPGSTGRGSALRTGEWARGRAKRGAGLPPAQAGEAGLPCLQVITSHLDKHGTSKTWAEEPFRLSGSARRSAYALEVNATKLVTVWGIERTLFVTLTFGGGKKGPSIRQAQAAFHQFEKHALSRRYVAGIKVLERGAKNGRVHFHLLLDAGVDVRLGADFAAIGAGHSESLNMACRAEYSWLRKHAPKFGFGKIVNALPIKSTEEGVARYISKYITKHMTQRLFEDKGARLCSYWGTARKHRECCSLKFSWARIGGWLFRAKLAGLSKLNGIKDQEGWAAKFGPRWAYQIQKFVKAFPLSKWPTAFHALADSISFDGFHEELSDITQIQIIRKMEIRWTRVQGKSFAWLALVGSELDWVERGRENHAPKGAPAHSGVKCEWVEVTEFFGDVMVAKTTERWLDDRATHDK